MARQGNNIYLRNTGKWEGRYIKGRAENGRLRYGYVSGASYEEALKRRDEASMAYAMVNIVCREQRAGRAAASFCMRPCAA